MTPKTIARSLKGFAAIAAAAAAVLNATAADAKFALKEFAQPFTSPVTMIPVPGSSGQMVVGDQVGIAYIVDKDGATRPQPFLDVRTKLAPLKQGFDERGLLGIAFHPKFTDNKRVFAYYSGRSRPDAPQGWSHTSKIVEYTVRDNLTVDFASEKVILEIDQPQENHNGGQVVFGPDGFLYIGTGDGGAGNDEGIGHHPQEGNGQRRDTLLGKILRLDVDSKQPYGIPKDNPFADGQKGRPEIYAYGLRNPWRITFDRGGKRELFAADIGQNLWEEVNIIKNGGNYGWRIREGFHCFDPKSPDKESDDCPKVGALGEPLLDPAFEYKNLRNGKAATNAFGISITGGYVYRGKALPQLQGKYIFADWSENWGRPMGVMLMATPPSGDSGQWKVERLPMASAQNHIGAYVVGFGEDTEGELYVLVNGLNGLIGKTGKVFKLTAAQ